MKYSTLEEAFSAYLGEDIVLIVPITKERSNSIGLYAYIDLTKDLVQTITQRLRSLYEVQTLDFDLDLATFCSPETLKVYNLKRFKEDTKTDIDLPQSWGIFPKSLLQYDLHRYEISIEDERLCLRAPFPYGNTTSQGSYWTAWNSQQDIHLTTQELPLSFWHTFTIEPERTLLDSVLKDREQRLTEAKEHLKQIHRDISILRQEKDALKADLNKSWQAPKSLKEIKRKVFEKYNIQDKSQQNPSYIKTLLDKQLSSLNLEDIDLRSFDGWHQLLIL